LKRRRFLGAFGTKSLFACPTVDSHKVVYGTRRSARGVWGRERRRAKRAADFAPRLAVQPIVAAALKRTLKRRAGSGGVGDSGHSNSQHTWHVWGQMQQTYRRPSRTSKGDTNPAAPPLTAQSPVQVGSVRLHINLDIAARLHRCLFRRSGLSILSTRRGRANVCSTGRLDAEGKRPDMNKPLLR
jgi:hypothetical protein